MTWPPAIEYDTADARIPWDQWLVGTRETSCRYRGCPGDTKAVAWRVWRGWFFRAMLCRCCGRHWTVLNNLQDDD